jgi:hypothetical protein
MVVAGLDIARRFSGVTGLGCSHCLTALTSRLAIFARHWLKLKSVKHKIKTLADARLNQCDPWMRADWQKECC